MRKVIYNTPKGIVNTLEEAKTIGSYTVSFEDVPESKPELSEKKKAMIIKRG